MEPTRIYWPGTEILRTDDLPAGTTVDLVVVNPGRYDKELAIDWLKLGRELYNRYNQYGLAVPGPLTTIGELSYVTVTDLMNEVPLNPINGLKFAMSVLAEQYLGFRTIGNSTENTHPVPGMASLWRSDSPFYNIGNTFTSDFHNWFNTNFGGRFPLTVADIERGQLLYALIEYNIVWVADDARWVGASQKTNRDRISDIGGEDTVANYYAYFGIDYWATKQARADAWMADPNVNLYDITVQYDLVINLPKILPGQDDDNGQLGSGGGTGDGQDEESTMWPVALLLAVLFLGGKKSYRA